MHGCLGGLGGGPSCEHYLLGGLAIRFVWGLGEVVLRFLGPQKLCGIYRCLYTELGHAVTCYSNGISNDQTPVDILCSNSAFGRFFIPRRVAAPPCFLAAHRRRGALKDFTRKNLRSENLRSSPIATPVNWAHETEHVSWKLTLTWTGNLGVKYQLRRTPD